MGDVMLVYLFIGNYLELYMDKESNIVVFLDTNSIDNCRLDSLFGNEDDLIGLCGVANIVVPSMVLDELIKHKEQHFLSKLKDLRANPLSKSVGVDWEIVEHLSFDMYEKRLREDQNIPFETCGPIDKVKVFNEMYKRVLNNDPPFNKGTDKGFKDAVIAISICDYINSHDNVDEYYVVTKDGRLRDFFNSDGELSVFIVGSVCEAVNCIEEGLSFECDIKSCDISKKASNKKDTLSLNEIVDELCNSYSFASTHKFVNQIQEHKSLISVHNGMRLLDAAMVNQQIWWILSDRDIQEFYGFLLHEFGDSLSDSEYDWIVDHADLPNDRFDESGNPRFSKYERSIYSEFCDELVSHIQSRSWLSYIRVKEKEIVPALRSIISTASLDERAAGWNDVVALFIDGRCVVSTSSLDINSLKNFIEYYSGCNIRKRTAIINAIKARLEEVTVSYDEDIPF